MSDSEKLNHPWLVAVWPGMGHVALSAGYYLMAKLGMHEIAELSAEGLFDIDSAVVKSGLIQPAHHPRSRFFAWKAPSGKRDIVVFIGEAQPPLGKYSFCEKLIDFANDLGVECIFTFAAMATQMHPEDQSHVFAAATDQETLDKLDRPDLQLLEEGNIGGLNGVLLAAAANQGVSGICLLGEMPHLFAQIPFPNASLAVLKIFTDMADVEIDFEELAEQGAAMKNKLGELLNQVTDRMRENVADDQEEEFGFGLQEEGLSQEEEDRIEKLFRDASDDRSKAYELKRELDRLEVFQEYEDRFLDLFKKGA